jgi:hypothetical protein
MGVARMKPRQLPGMTVDQLVDRFTAIALDQDKALLRREHAKFNRLLKQSNLQGRTNWSSASPPSRSIKTIQSPVRRKGAVEDELTHAMATNGDSCFVSPIIPRHRFD